MRFLSDEEKRREKAECRFSKWSTDVWDEDRDKKPSEILYQAPEPMILVDRITGVNYLCAMHIRGVGLTVLVDENGKPIVTKEAVQND